MLVVSYLNTSRVFSDVKFQESMEYYTRLQTAAVGLRRPSVVGVHGKIENTKLVFAQTSIIHT